MDMADFETKYIRTTLVVLAGAALLYPQQAYSQDIFENLPTEKRGWRKAMRESRRKTAGFGNNTAEAARIILDAADSANFSQEMAKGFRSGAKKTIRDRNGHIVSGYVMGYTVENGDTIYIDRIQPAYALNKPVYDLKKKEWRKFYKLIYNFKKTYPYALQAKKAAQQVDSIVAAEHMSGREQDEYVKAFEKKLFKEFEKPLRNLTVTQGRLLMKLIDREMGLTTFYVIKNYRGRFKAFMWQGVARLFGSNLKTPYDRFGKDKKVEELVKMWEAGTFDPLYYSIFYK